MRWDAADNLCVVGFTVGSPMCALTTDSSHGSHADTPIDTLTQTADNLHPDLVVLTTTTPQRLSRVRSELRELSETTRLAVAGAGTTDALAASVGAELLNGDPVSQAARIVAPH
jgi:methanogenic corrinoid protein MtbC1